MKNQAHVKTVVMRNHAKSIEIELTEAWENSERDEKHQSSEVKEDVFYIRALTEINNILLKRIQKNIECIEHIASQI